MSLLTRRLVLPFGGCLRLASSFCRRPSGTLKCYSCNQKGLSWTKLSSISRLFSSEIKSDQSFTVHPLASRGLVHVKGKDSADFLQGLITNDINLIQASKSAMYTMFLNVQGRVMYDMIVYNTSGDPGHPTFLVECDQSITDSLLKEIKKYKLRKKVEISNVTDDHKVIAVLSSDSDSAAELSVPDSDCVMFTSDPRVRQFGWRLITGTSKDFPMSSLGILSSEEDYHIRRYQWGISEGCVDLPTGNCFPLESNLVFLNGASFQKGCYIGQELTARTYHTGVTRKRLMPLVFDRPLENVPAGCDIVSEDKKPAGKYRHSIGQYGLGLMRLSEINKTLMLKTESGSCYNVSTSVPKWWPENNTNGSANS